MEIEGKEYLAKESFTWSSCHGCAFDTKSPKFCSTVRCLGIIFVEDTPEAITNYLELKLNYGERKDGNED